MAGVVDEGDRGVDPKYCLTPTPNPAALTQLGCSSVPIVVVNISCLPWLTKLRCELYYTRSSYKK